MRYSKPIGYNTECFNSLSSKAYKPFNGYMSGSENYAPGQYSPQVATLTFGASAPADTSSITVPDGPANDPGTPTDSFVFTWGGAPGAGIIPLVGGGGTAAQAATATQVALSAQLSQWIVELTAPTVVRLTSRQPGVNIGPGLVGATGITITTVLAALRALLPARFGKNFAWLANDTVDVPVEGA